MMNSQFVSRAGEKLYHAITNFEVDVTELMCADFGSSTGGFVDCLLQQGASKVYSVDTSYGELAWKLRNDGRVVVMERKNAMHIKLPEKVDLITIDVGWTKQELIIPNASWNLKDDGKIITLIKPHYEASQLVRGGKLDEKFEDEILDKVTKKIESLGLKVIATTVSPIVGKRGGNTEYLSLVEKQH
ncbi:TlyA family rRNA (cytidine-2'-O)-methyltransferase [Candidatus Woesebacteria bacterium]|nr:MAG: TlyA family rRNA (cytidine-2'-O)-methyltransferase [Candidatus Woesebacteria bacterium]